MAKAKEYMTILVFWEKYWEVDFVVPERALHGYHLSDPLAEDHVDFMSGTISGALVSAV